MSFPLLLPTAFITRPYFLHTYLHVCVWNIIAVLAPKPLKTFLIIFYYLFPYNTFRWDKIHTRSRTSNINRKVIIVTVCHIVKQLSVFVSVSVHI